MQDPQFRQLLNHFGFSWAGFRRVRKGVKKRLARHMLEMGCKNIDEYIEIIEKDREVHIQFERLMTVSISRFFRDRKLWEIMRGEILPLMLEKKNQMVKVWSAGCASGEEVYSFKILWEEKRKSFKNVPGLNLLASDMNPAYLDRAKAGVYSRSSMREVPDEIMSVYFNQTVNGKYVLKSRAKMGIEWQVHHLLSDPPEIAFDLIFLRNNLLTYYADEVIVPAVGKMVDSLTPKGFLIIGSHERMPFERADLSQWGDSTYIYQRHY